jgi:hypothetical protein
MARAALLCLLSLGLLTLSGCPKEPEEPIRCSPGLAMVRDGAMPAQRELNAGVGFNARFRPYEDGGPVRLTGGLQGAWMVTPVLQVAAEADAAEDGCFLVTVENHLEDGTPVDEGFVRAYPFRLVDGVYQSREALQNQLGNDELVLFGKTLLLDVLVQAPEFEARRSYRLIIGE